VKHRPGAPAAAPGEAAADPSAAAAAVWHLRLLGGFELARGGLRLHHLASRPTALLLARLALWPQRDHPREELVDLLWPQAPLEAGRNRLRQALSALRSVLERGPGSSHHAPVIDADRLALRLLPGRIDCDVPAFKSAVAAGRFALARELYRGELLPGYFAEWVVEERRTLERMAELLAPPAAHQHAPLHDRPAATTPEVSGLPVYLTRWVGGLGPVQALLEALSLNRLVVVRGPGGAGKTRLAVETARHTTLEVRLEVQAERVVFVALAAARNRQDFHEAVARALGCEGYAGNSVNAAAARRSSFTATASITATASVPHWLLDSLAGQRSLLVLDNFEQLAEPCAAELLRWLAALPQLRLLVTSRRALRLDGEHEISLSALPLPPPPAAAHSLHEQEPKHQPEGIEGLKHQPEGIDLLANPAVQLFADRARAVQAPWAEAAARRALPPEQAAQVAAIVRRLEGLPLAIELAAARLRSLSLGDLHALLINPNTGALPGPNALPLTLASTLPLTLPSSLPLLARSGPRGGDDSRHASMLSVVTWSIAQLAAPERELLELLAVQRGSSTLSAVALASGLPVAEAARRLDELAACSVLHTRDDAAGQRRYEPFEPVREALLLGQGGTQRQAGRWAWQRWAALRTAALGPAPNLHAFAEDLPALVDVWCELLQDDAPHSPTAAASTGAQQVHRMAVACAAALDDLSLPASAVAVLQAACANDEGPAATALPGAAPDPWLGRVHALLALQLYEAGQPQAALAHIDTALGHTPPGHEQRAAVLAAAARVRLRAAGDFAAAAAWIDEGLVLTLHKHQPSLHARFCTLAGALVARRDRDQPRKHALDSRAVALWREHGPPTRLPEGLVNLALAEGDRRRPLAQLPLLEEARHLAATHGQWRLLAFVHSVHAAALADLRRWPEALAQHQACLRVAFAHQAWREWFYGLWNLPLSLVALARPGHQGDFLVAARLLACAEAFGSERYGPLTWGDVQVLRKTLRLLRRHLPPAELQAAWVAGRALSPSQAQALAVGALTTRVAAAGQQRPG
jgi:tetratricopeptide (TPR) repeat protein